MPRYRDAIGWIAYNDDNEWLDSGRISVAAAMVADLFNKTDEQVTADLRRALKRRSPMPDAPPTALAAAEEIVRLLDECADVPSFKAGVAEIIARLTPAPDVARMREALETIRDAFWSDGETPAEQVADLKGVALAALAPDDMATCEKD